MIKIKQAIKNQKYLYSLIKNVRGALQKQKIKQAGANKNIKIEFSNYHIDLKKRII
jgi:hypothetical protein